MMTLARFTVVLGLLSLGLPGAARADERPASPRGSAAVQLGKGGKWIEVDYGRPLLRGRSNIFGSGADYGKQVDGGAPVWRLGANEVTHLKTEVPISFGGKKLQPGSYDLFAKLDNGAWTLIVSTQPFRAQGEPKSPDKTWGAYGYDPKYDVARVPMNVGKSDVAVEQLTIGFVDMTPKGGKLQVAWDHTTATAPFALE
jgi:hypothetical protein